MQTVHLTRLIHAPIETVFDCITDHARYVELPGVSAARLIERGRPDRNGLGALREIRASGLSFVERIVAYDRPHRFDYKIVRSTLPLNHEAGWMACTETLEGTEVQWTTRFRVALPLVGGPGTRIVAWRVRSAFGDLLDAFAARCESEAGS